MRAMIFNFYEHIIKILHLALLNKVGTTTTKSCTKTM